MGPSRHPVICVGEALVDLICPDPVGDPSLAERFEARAGGALANVAVRIARDGESVGLAGGLGADGFGAMLRRRLAAERVDLSDLATLEEVETPYAFVTFDRAGEPSFRIAGSGIEAGISALAGRELDLVDGASAVVVGSNTMVGESARAVTAAVREQALRAGVPVAFDPNLRPGRWPDLELARRRCLEAIEGAFVVKANLSEARWLTGEPSAEPDRAAESLAELGARVAVVTAGPALAVARGEAAADAAPPELEVVSPLGAGDAFMGALVASLSRGAWDPAAVASAVPAAAIAGAEACGHLGAID
jgi:sugar/nucleoside kinase (ribokinase family)